MSMAAQSTCRELTALVQLRSAITHARNSLRLWRHRHRLAMRAGAKPTADVCLRILFLQNFIRGLKWQYQRILAGGAE